MLRYQGWLVLLLLMIVPVESNAQVSSSELEKRWKQKQEAAFLKHVSWERTLESARTRARRDNLPIVAYFTRSYAP